MATFYRRSSRLVVALEWTDENDEAVQSGSYDQPLQKEKGDPDDNPCAEPCRQLTNWFISRGDEFETTRELLPETMRWNADLYLYGELEPREKEIEFDGKYLPLFSQEKQKNLKIVLKRVKLWDLDTSHSKRGIWVQTKARAWYKLKQPNKMPEVCLPNTNIITNQEQLFLPTRAVLGLICNLCDMMEELCNPTKESSGCSSLHLARSPEDLYSILTPSDEAKRQYPELNSDPFDLQLLRKKVAFVRKILRRCHQELTDDCAFYKGLLQMELEYEEAFRREEDWATGNDNFDYLASALAAEKRSNRHPWGDLLRVEMPRLNQWTQIQARETCPDAEKARDFPNQNDNSSNSTSFEEKIGQTYVEEPENLKNSTDEEMAPTKRIKKRKRGRTPSIKQQHKENLNHHEFDALAQSDSFVEAQSSSDYNERLIELAFSPRYKTDKKEKTKKKHKVKTFQKASASLPPQSPINAINLIERPHVMFSVSCWETAQQKIGHYLVRPGKTKQGIQKEKALAFVSQIIKVKNVLSMEFMLACVEALAHSNGIVHKFLFDEKEPKESGCWYIFKCWWEKANERIKNRCADPQEKNLFEATDGQERTEEKIVVALMDLIIVCCGKEEEGKIDPGAIKETFGVDLVACVEKSISLFQRHGIIISYIVPLTKTLKHLLQIKRSKEKPRKHMLVSTNQDVSRQNSSSCLEIISRKKRHATHQNTRDSTLDEQNNLLAQQLEGQTECAGHKNIPDFLLRKEMRQKLLAERAEVLGKENTIKKLAKENAKLRQMIECTEKLDDNRIPAARCIDENHQKTRLLGQSRSATSGSKKRKKIGSYALNGYQASQTSVHGKSSDMAGKSRFQLDHKVSGGLGNQSTKKRDSNNSVAPSLERIDFSQNNDGDKVIEVPKPKKQLASFDGDNNLGDIGSRASSVSTAITRTHQGNIEDSRRCDSKANTITWCLSLNSLAAFGMDFNARTNQISLRSHIFANEGSHLFGHAKNSSSTKQNWYGSSWENSSSVSNRNRSRDDVKRSNNTQNGWFKSSSKQKRAAKGVSWESCNQTSKTNQLNRHTERDNGKHSWGGASAGSSMAATSSPCGSNSFSSSRIHPRDYRKHSSHSSNSKNGRGRSSAKNIWLSVGTFPGGRSSRNSCSESFTGNTIAALQERNINLDCITANVERPINSWRSIISSARKNKSSNHTQLSFSEHSNITGSSGSRTLEDWAGTSSKNAGAVQQERLQIEGSEVVKHNQWSKSKGNSWASNSSVRAGDFPYSACNRADQSKRLSGWGRSCSGSSWTATGKTKGNGSAKTRSQTKNGITQNRDGPVPANNNPYGSTCSHWGESMSINAKHLVENCSQQSFTSYTATSKDNICNYSIPRKEGCIRSPSKSPSITRNNTLKISSNRGYKIEYQKNGSNISCHIVSPQGGMRHPTAVVHRTKQPICTPEITALVSSPAKGPDLEKKLPTRETIILESNGLMKKAHAFWIPNDMISACMKATEKLIKFCRSPSVSKWSKPHANGTCMEFGVGTGAGHQSSSFLCTGEATNLSYLRNEKCFVQSMDVLYSPIESEIAFVLSKCFPDMFDSKVLLDGYGPLKKASRKIISGMSMVEGGFPFLQRALRLNGHGINANDWRRERAKEGGSPLHYDAIDYEHKVGNIILYLNPFENHIEGSDLLIFGESTGGRAVKIPTMVPGWLCAVIFPSATCLHGSAFPHFPLERKSVVPSEQEAIRIVLYTLKDSVKLAKMGGTNLKHMMTSWKDAILELDKKYLWRHVPVYNSVCNSLNEEDDYEFDSIETPRARGAEGS